MQIGTVEPAESAGEDFSDAASTFGDRLTFAREALGVDQAQLAQRMGIKDRTLRHWEEDQAEPRANRLQMLAGMLNVSMVWLMTGQGKPPAPAPSRGEGALADCLAELRQLRVEQARIAERTGRLEKRLREALR
jgi:transcriptional regulator with XRE-family HTH domain